MLDYARYFQNDYQFALEELRYTRVDAAPGISDGRVELKVSDCFSSEVSGQNLRVKFARDVFFDPEAVFSIRVVFFIGLHFLDGIREEDKTAEDWSRAFEEQSPPFFQNVISRVVGLIASVTSSYGQPPLLTPNTFTAAPK